MLSGHYPFLLATALVGALLSVPTGSGAQTITPALDGTGTAVYFDGQTYQVSGGHQSGSNLFHSFQQFGLDSNQIAQFLAHPQLTHILARVTGGSPSPINGTLQVVGGQPHLYLMNPAGILFGPQAQLNVPGDFFATTADQIGFEGGGWFQAGGANDYARLVGSPNQFAFVSAQPGAIANQGSLTVAPGQTLSLLGGTVINRGALTAPGGQVLLAAVPGERLVRVSQPGMLLSLDLPAEAVAAGVRPLELPALLTGAGWPAVNPGDLVTPGLVWGDRVHLAAAGRVRPGDPAQIRTGDGRDSAPTVTHFAARPQDPLALVALDATVPDYQALLYGGRAGTTIVTVRPAESGIERVGQELAAWHDLGQPVAEVHIVSEGQVGNFWLGRDLITADTVATHQPQWQGWRDNLAANAEILLYSCFTALGSLGDALLRALATTTGATIAASTDRTGSAALGGNWTLEATTGAVAAELAFRPETLGRYEHTLDLFTVTTGAAADDSAAVVGSLRWAIAQANGNLTHDEIRFAPDVAEVQLQAGSLTINTAYNLTLDGQGRHVRLQGNNTFGLFRILDGPGTVTFDSLTLTGGNAAGNGGAINHLANTATLTVRNSTILGNQAALDGGGLFSQGPLNLINTTVQDNQAQRGGGLFNNGAATLSQVAVIGNQANEGGGLYQLGPGNTTINTSTFSGNQAAYQGGGMVAGPSAVLTLRNATVAANQAGQGGGLQAIADATIQLESSIVANNRDPSGALTDISGGNLQGNARNLLTSLAGKTSGSLGTGSDLVVADPGLAPLGDYGGFTPTHALLPHSPALEAGYQASGLATDQRGVARQQGSAPDIGAYESAGFLVERLGGDRQVALTNQPFGQSLELRLTEGAFGRPLPQAPITVVVPGRGASAIAPSFTVWTDADGLARINLQANFLPGTYAVRATLSPVLGVDFELTNLGTNGIFDFNSLLPPLQSGFLGESPWGMTAAEPTPLDAAVETLDRQLAKVLADHLGLAEESPVSLATVRRQLQAVEAQTGQRPAIIYAFFRPAAGAPHPWQFDVAETQPTLPPPEPTDILELTLITAAGETIQVRVPEARRDRVEALTRRLRRSVTNPNRGADIYLPPAQQLQAWLVEPLAADLERLQVDTLAWVADAGLRSLPWAVLHDGQQFLVERYSLGLLPALALADLDYRPLTQATVLAMGAEQFADQHPLPGVPLEIEAIAQRLWPGRTFLNEAFTVTNFQKARAAQAFRIVHLATHGEFRPGSFKNSYIQFWDHRLTLDRLSELGLQQPPVDLLVLSACRTALGDPNAEMGFAGLAVAAGVKSALGSLWYVSDEGTLALMTHFYGQLRQAPLVAAALQEAQVAMLRGEVVLRAGELVTPSGAWPRPSALADADPGATHDLSHPYYWSAFTLIGSPW